MPVSKYIPLIEEEEEEEEEEEGHVGPRKGAGLGWADEQSSPLVDGKGKGRKGPPPVTRQESFASHAQSQSSIGSSAMESAMMTLGAGQMGLSKLKRSEWNREVGKLSACLGLSGHVCDA